MPSFDNGKQRRPATGLPRLCSCATRCMIFRKMGRLGYQYSYRNFPVVERQLLLAGVRLAGVLNEIYG